MADTAFGDDISALTSAITRLSDQGQGTHDALRTLAEALKQPQGRSVTSAFGNAGGNFEIFAATNEEAQRARVQSVASQRTLRAAIAQTQAATQSLTAFSPVSSTSAPPPEPGRAYPPTYDAIRNAAEQALQRGEDPTKAIRALKGAPPPLELAPPSAGGGGIGAGAVAAASAGGAAAGGIFGGLGRGLTIAAVLGLADRANARAFQFDFPGEASTGNALAFRNQQLIRGLQERANPESFAAEFHGGVSSLFELPSGRNSRIIQALEGGSEGVYGNFGLVPTRDNSRIVQGLGWLWDHTGGKLIGG